MPRLALVLLLLAAHPMAAEAPVDAAAVADRLAGAIRFETISHQDPADFDGQPFEGLIAYLTESFPRVHEALRVRRINGYSLLYEWKGLDPALDPALFMSHLDVVPVEAEALDAWTHPPFEGVIADGYVWGRGALDVKNGVIIWLEAAEMLLAEGFTPTRTLLFAFGHDEEIGGDAGAAEIARTLREEGTRVSFLIDEGGMIGEGVSLIPGKAIASINTAEKTYFTVHLTARSEGGHSSTPPPHTAVGKLATAIHRLEANPFPLTLTQPVRDMFAAMAPHSSTAQRLALDHLWLTEGFVMRTMAEDDYLAAMLRTTTAATIFHGGVKENVIPKRATATVNFRILPGQTPDDVLEHIRQVVDDSEIEVQADAWSAAPRPGRVDAPGYRILEEAVLRVHPEAVVLPGLLLGGTDTRHYADVADDSYRFIAARVSSEQISGVHGTNERIAVDALAEAVDIHRHILRRSGSE